MDHSLGISEFKARCIALLKEVQQTGHPLVITHRGQPLVRIEPIREERKLGALRHLGSIQADLLACDFSDEWES